MTFIFYKFLIHVVFVLGIEPDSINQITAIKVFQIGLNKSHIVGSSIIHAVSIAVDEINARKDLLSNYKLVIDVMDYKQYNDMAEEFAKQIIQESMNRKRGELISPLILGAPFSSTSRRILPILNAYNFGLLSSFATGSDLKTYQFFYRTIPNEENLSKALLELCRAFEWNNIGILYLDNDNGRKFKQVIMNHATVYNNSDFMMQIKPIPYEYSHMERPDTLIDVLNAINDNDLYIMILIARSTDIKTLLSKFGSYPRYFIGIDWWFEENIFKKFNFTSLIQGYVGSYPISVGDSSNNISHRLESKWNLPYTISIFAKYGYDSTFALAHALDIFDQQYDLSLLSSTNSSQYAMNMLHNIMIHNLSFLGSTGRVSFDDNGDREHATYGYGYVSEDAHIKTFGTFTDFFDTEINRSIVEWPPDFQSKNHIPLPFRKVYKQQITITTEAFVFVCAICALSAAFIIFYVHMVICKQDKTMQNSTYGLNFIICIGCALGHIAIIVYGMENIYFQQNYHVHGNLLFNILCNFHLWILPIVFSLVYTPLFARSYRLSSITVQAMQKNVLELTILTNGFLYIIVTVSVMVDVLLLITFILIQIITNQYMYLMRYETFQLEYIAGDPMIVIEYKCPVCESDSPKIVYFFYGSITFYKLMQLAMGISFSFKVWYVKFETKHHQETKWLLLSVFVTIAFICIAVSSSCVIKFTYTNLTMPYIIVSLSTLLVTNSVLWFNVCPRLLHAIFGKNENGFEMNAEERMKSAYHEIMKKDKSVLETESLINTTSTWKPTESTRFSHLHSDEHSLQLCTM